MCLVGFLHTKLQAIPAWGLACCTVEVGAQLRREHRLAGAWRSIGPVTPAGELSENKVQDGGTRLAFGKKSRGQLAQCVRGGSVRQHRASLVALGPQICQDIVGIAQSD